MILLLRNAITREFFVLCCIGTSILSSLPTKQYNFHCHVHNISKHKVSTSYRNQLSQILTYTDFYYTSIVFFIRIKYYFDKNYFFPIWAKISYMLEIFFFWKNNNNNHKYNHPKNILKKKKLFF